MRKSGILMPVFSLPSRQATGTLGKGAYDFVRFLAAAGQKVWQVLPLCPVDPTFSPYQSCCVFAGEPLFIDFELLVKDGLLSKDDINNVDRVSERCDYAAARSDSDRMLKAAYLSPGRMRYAEEYAEFKEENAFWLEDFALYSAIKSTCGGAAWDCFPAALKNRESAALSAFAAEHADAVEYARFTQYLFFKQWRALKDYANGLGISIFGDMPIYTAYDSADVWANRDIFMLDGDGRPAFISGTPPDAYSAKGQIWGGPLYNFARQANGPVPYRWWKERLRHALTVYDIIRIDHFRAFDAFFAIPAGKEAADGAWMPGPSLSFFEEIERALGNNLPIVAEDLGVITDSVRTLLDKTGYAGMRVLQFAFDGNKNNPYLPHNLVKNCIAYIGTHDNETLMQFEKERPQQAQRLKYYIGDTCESFNWAVIRLLSSSVADTVIFTMQDIMGQGGEYRFNTPGTVGGNWVYRIDPSCPNDWLAGIIKKLTALYGRC